MPSNVTVGGFVASCVGLGIMAASIVAAYDGRLAVSSALLLAVCVFAVVSAPPKLGVLSWQAGIPAFYALIFVALPLTSRVIGITPEVSDSEMAAALLVAAMGVFAFTVATHLVRLGLSSSTRHDLWGLLKPDACRRPLLILLLVVSATLALLWSYAYGYFGLIPTAGSDAGEAAGAISAVAFLLTVGHVMAWTGFFAGGGSRLFWLGLTSTVIMLTFGFVANSKGQIVAPLFYIALCWWGASGRFPWKLTIASLVLYAFLAFPFVTASRLLIQAEEFGGSRYELAGLMIDHLLSAKWREDAETSFAIDSLGRGLLTYFAQIVHQAGNSVPFMSGRTYVQAGEILLPRFVYPDKPDMNIGNWTAQAFGVIDPADQVTNMSPTFIGEFYMNAGLGGVLAGMFLLGMVATLVDRFLIIDRRSWTMPIMVGFVAWQESVVGHTIIPFVKNAILWVPLLLLMIHLLPRIAAARKTATGQGPPHSVN
jgi:hypothetical protein